MRSSRTRRLRLASGAVAVGSAFALATVIPSASAATGRHILVGTTPGWISKAQPLATLPSSSAVSFGILLKMRNEAAAVAQLQALSDPDSASYGDWLTNTAFDAEYAPAASDVSAVESWLGKEGFSVTTTLRSGMLIEVAGSAAQIESTFGTSLEDYNLAGKTVRGNTTALSLPADTPTTVAAAIDSVVGVDQGSTLKTPAETLPGPPAGSRYGVQPCSAYYDQKVATNQPTAYGKPQPYAVCGYTPQQYQSAYGESSLLDRGVDGRGVTVAITDAYAAPTMLKDAQLYNLAHHEPLFAPGQYSQITPSANGYGLVGPNDCDAQGSRRQDRLRRRRRLRLRS
jgi:subtilase family serine protease